MESSPTRSIPTVSMSTYVGAGVRGNFEIGIRYKVNKHNILLFFGAFDVTYRFTFT